MRAALTFTNAPLDPFRWLGKQPDGTLVGSIRDYGDGFHIGMIDANGHLVPLGRHTTLRGAMHRLVRAWQQQIAAESR